MLLSLRNVAVDRGERRVIDDLSLDVSSGEAVVLRGPNGAGKTTLIRAIAGLLRPAAGTIELTDDVAADAGRAEEPETVSERCHYVGHQNAIAASLTVRENLAFWANYLGASDAGALDKALTGFDLEPLADVPAAYLSAGQKRRAALARLAVAERPLWLLDEPTVSLDAASTARLAAVIDGHTAKGGIVVAATHLPLGLRSERIVTLGRGREAAS
ncbi:MAG: heme ABC exporter ATP-binding protein CcmA [Hyphomicrobium sp.]|nr:heme ABC exporter ATP-binding protein CcmA [Hyphomicrobium sp.]